MRADEAAVHGLVAGAAARNEGDLARHGRVGADEANVAVVVCAAEIGELVRPVFHGGIAKQRLEDHARLDRPDCRAVLRADRVELVRQDVATRTRQIADENCR